MKPSTEDLHTFYNLFGTSSKGYGRLYMRELSENRQGKPGRYIRFETEPVIDNFADHLNGDYLLQINPLHSKRYCDYCVIDVDIFNEAKRKLVKLLNDWEVPVQIFESKSGGLHLYFLLVNPVKVGIIRAYAHEIILTLNLNKIVSPNNFGANVIPSMDYVMNGGYHKYINLPLFDIKHNKCPLIYKGEKIKSFDEAISILRNNKPYTTIELVNDWLKSAPINSFYDEYLKI